MWRVWLMFDVRRAIIGLHVFLAVLAFTIHFILLSTERYNWLNGTSWTTSSVQTESISRPS
ncbi:MAG: light-harvesting antenna LH1, alpha subunit [Pseudomonadota bacterium]